MVCGRKTCFKFYDIAIYNTDELPLNYSVSN